MNTLEYWGIGAFALISIVFYLARKIPVYAALCAAVLGLFAYMTIGLVDWNQPGEWLIFFTGLALSSFGLLIVRVMLIRSVSLQLLARLTAGDIPGRVTDDIGGRLKDMEYFRLIRRGDLNRLTAFGWFCSFVVVIFYTLFRIK